mgnify:CR=1 FL=1
MNKKLPRFVAGFQDTRKSGEDIALTPYLFGVWSTNGARKIRGVGICWGFYAVYLGLAWGIPAHYPSLRIL